MKTKRILRKAVSVILVFALLISGLPGLGIQNVQGATPDIIDTKTLNLSYARKMAVDSAGNIYIASHFNSVVKIDTAGNISPFAGTGATGYSGDGELAINAKLDGVDGVAIDSSGNIYIADRGNHRVRKVDKITGVISTIAGTGVASSTGNGGLATSATLNVPIDIALDSVGNIYISEYSGNRIRKVDKTTGNISAFAGTGSGTFSGDGAAATSAGINSPWGIAVDSADNIYIAEDGSRRIRKVDKNTGYISTVAGSGQSGNTGDGGPAIDATFSGPAAVAVDSVGNIYIADPNNRVVRKVDKTTGKISRFAGTGTFGNTGDGGPASSATLSSPMGLLASANNIYIASNDYLRVVGTGYSVTYDSNSATSGSVPQHNRFFLKGFSTNVLGNSGSLEKLGFVFKGWNTLADGNGTSYAVGASYTIPEGDTTLYAKWAPANIVTFNTDGGSTVASQNIETGGKVTQPNAPTKTGYAFGGWYTSSDKTTVFNFADTLITGATTIYAKWTINSYNITYNGNSNTGGTVPTAQSGVYNTSLALQSNSGVLVRTGYTFDGWNTQANGTGTSYAVDAAYTIPASNTILYAKWSVNSYNITYSDNSSTGGTVPDSQFGNYNTNVTLQTNSGTLVKTNYTFAGWNTQADGKGTSYAVGANYTIPASNTTLYAKWTIDKYTVSFDVDAGSEVADQTIDHGGKVTLPTAPTKTGNTFGGWYTSSDKTTLFNFTDTLITSATTIYAKWTINSYDITYNSNGSTTGTVPMSQSGDYNTSITLRSNSGILERTGYTFDGWNTQADGTGTSYAVDAAYTIPASHTTLYAKWTINSYSITYDDNGSTGGTVPDSQFGNYNTNVILRTNSGLLERTNYTFIGWNTKADGTGTNYAVSGNYSVPASDTILYANWVYNQYTVNFNVDGGSAVGNQTINHGEKVTLPTAPTKIGHTFEGWYTNSDKTTLFNFDTTLITSATTIYAKWTINSYNITYNDNGSTDGTVPTGQSGNYNTSVTLQSNSGILVRTGYTFAGWNTQADGNGITYAVGATYTIPASNTTLYAKWTINSYNITYNGNGSTTGTVPTAQSGNYSTSIELRTNSGSLVRTGYTFAGWNTQADGTGTTYAVGATYTIPASNTTLYAKWTINSYNITYNANGNTSGTVPTAQSGNYNTIVTLQSNSGTLLRTGYTFAGWNTQADGNGTSYVVSADYTIPASDTTLYANWSINSYDINYNDNGSTGGTVPDYQFGNYNTSIALSNNSGFLVKTGYTFAGWNTQADGNGTSYAVNVNYTIPATNTTLYANWTINQYTVNFNVDGGSAVGNQTINHGDKVTLPTAPNKIGYTFDGWYTSSDKTTLFNFDTSLITSATTIYAKWSINSYDITYNSNGSTGGDVPTSQSGDFDTDIALRTNSGVLVRNGYTFAGWNTQADGNGTSYAVGAEYTIPASDTTLYAKWSINSYDITYDSNGSTGGTVPDYQFGNYSTSVTLRTNSGVLVKTGYTFAGWNTQADGTGISYAVNTTYTIPASDTTLYAKWSINSYDITYNSNGSTGGTVPDYQFGNYNSSITLQSNAGMLVKTWYKLVGWNTQADGNGTSYLEEGNFIIPENHTTLYAEWSNLNLDTDGDGKPDLNIDTDGDGEPDLNIDTDGDGEPDLNIDTDGDGKPDLNIDTDGDGEPDLNIDTDGDGTPDLNIDTDGDGTPDLNIDMNYDYDTLEVIYADGDSVNQVKGSVFLTKNGFSRKTTVTWITSDPDYLTDTGRTTRPGPEATDVSVTLTATLTDTVTSAQRTKTFNLTVLKMSNEDAAKDAAVQLSVNNAFTFSDADAWEAITTQFLMLITGAHGTTITWKSDNADVIRIESDTTSAAGIITRPDSEDVNVILTATIEKSGFSLEKKFLLVVKNKSVTKEAGETRQSTSRDADATVNPDGTLVNQKIDILRTILNDETKIDTVVVSVGDIQALTDSINPKETDSSKRLVSITTTQPANDKADELTFEIPAAAIRAMADKNALLNIQSDEGSIKLDQASVDALADRGTDLYFRIIPLKDAAEQNSIKNQMAADNTVLVQLGNMNLAALGIPRKIETNYTGVATKVILPFTGIIIPAQNREEFLNSLRIYIQHSDGTTAFIVGIILKDSSGNPVGIEFEINKFSSFQLARIMTPSSSSNSETDTNQNTVESDIGDGKIKDAVDVDKKDDGSIIIKVKHDEFKEILKDAKSLDRIVIPVISDANPVTVELDADLVKDLNDKGLILNITTKRGTLEIPPLAINIDALTDIFGKNVDLKDVKVNITMETFKDEKAAKIKTQVEKTGAKVMTPSVRLDITAVYGGKTVTIGQLDEYVTLILPIPDNVDPTKITTAVFVDSYGGVHHTPTVVLQMNGKYYAKANFFNAGVTYVLVWNPVEFVDVANHWAKDAVNDMGSRMIISGVGNGRFEPNREITRAEFAAIVVRAVGLMPDSGSNPFADVIASKWYFAYIQTASEYGIVSGYGNGQFRPNDKITREQAMTMVSRAMKLTGLKMEFLDDEAETLLAGFGDASEPADYAKNSIAACVKAGIVSGKNGNLLAPKDDITRAEVAIIIKRLLQKSNLI